MTIDLTVTDSTIKNAGVNGTASNRNVLTNTSGRITFTNCIVGQDDAAALAGYYFDIDGTAGSFTYQDGELLGTAPIADLATGTIPLRYMGSIRGRMTSYRGGAAPTVGAYNKGDIVYNTAPAATGFVGWVCVTSGTPGTWKTFGVISA